MYVSDRRFMKAVNLLQVAAHADGRDQVPPPAETLDRGTKAVVPCHRSLPAPMSATKCRLDVA